MRDHHALIAEASQALRGAASLARTEMPLGGEGASAVVFQGREPKVPMDQRLDDLLHSSLAATAVPVISEERGTDWQVLPEECFIVDPLDGSLNYQRGSGPSAISLAYWCGEIAFGIVHRLDTDHHYVGGVDTPATCDGRPISVSTVLHRSAATVAGGIPSRFDTEASRPDAYFSTMLQFAKVRMLGSAAVSLALVAQGSIDAYSEQGIMLWDVAAGLALVRAAGGRVAVDRIGLGPMRVWAASPGLGTDGAAWTLQGLPT